MTDKTDNKPMIRLIISSRNKKTYFLRLFSEMSQIPEEACAPETDFDSDSDSETTAVPIQKSKHVQEWF